MDEDEDVEQNETLPARRFYKADVIVIGFGLVRGIAEAFRDAAMEIRQVAAMHVNWEFQQTVFHEQAVQEIETLISGDDK